MTIKSTERKFTNPGKTGDERITKYYVETVERKNSNPRTFIITESENNKKGFPIGDNLITNAASFVAKYYELEGHQVTIFAEMRNGNFNKCSFRDYRPTIGADPQIDFIPGGGKIEVSREYVENETAKSERWKQQPQVDFNWEEAGLTPLNKFVQNPDKQPEKKQEPDLER